MSNAKGTDKLCVHCEVLSRGSQKIRIPIRRTGQNVFFEEFGVKKVDPFVSDKNRPLFRCPLPPNIRVDIYSQQALIST